MGSNSSQKYPNFVLRWCCRIDWIISACIAENCRDRLRQSEGGLGCHGKRLSSIDLTRSYDYWNVPGESIRTVDAPPATELTGLSNVFSSPMNFPTPTLVALA